jgi:hypothetical protein
LRIHLVEHILAIEERPHFPDRLIAYPGDNAADGFQNGVGGSALVPPVLLGPGELIRDRLPIAVLLEAQDVASGGSMLHIVNAGPDIDQRLHHRMLRHILDAPAVDIYLAAVADGIEVLLTGSNHIADLHSGTAPRPGHEVIIAHCQVYRNHINTALCFRNTEAN